MMPDSASFLASVFDSFFRSSSVSPLRNVGTNSWRANKATVQSTCNTIHTVTGIHLEKDMSVPFGHTVATTVCLFEILCARN